MQFKPVSLYALRNQPKNNFAPAEHDTAKGQLRAAHDFKPFFS
jgi:hypothetical protein